ncbi:MAG TPA: carbohydrate kinase [Planctomycetes bacterium]|nr:carbohydrate kinase [Planctomycetota bacterium]
MSDAVMCDLITIGEVLWDLFPDGKKLGGATFNLAFHARQLGVAAGAVSRVGADGLGEEILAAAERAGLPRELLQVDPALPTGTVAVALDPEGKPAFTITRDVAWDAIAFEPALAEALPHARAIAFGSLAQRSAASRATIRAAVERSGAAIKLCDINLRPPFVDRNVIRWCLAAATHLKINDDELRALADIAGLRGDEAASCRQLAREFDLEAVCVTKGAAGCAAYAGGEEWHVPGIKVKVADTVGAGDAFAAGFAAELLAGRNPGAAARFANAIGALVASKPGATPPLAPDEIAAAALA